MELLVDRYEQSTNGLATIGKLSIDGVFECYTLEPTVREVAGQPVSSWKIMGKTAVPQGRYKVTMVWSPKHSCIVPLVNGIEDFQAVEIHPGNRDVDTAACLLVGLVHVPSEDFIGESNLAWNALMLKLEEAMGLFREAVDGKGRPLHYNQEGQAQEVWITYQNNIPMVTDADLAT